MLVGSAGKASAMEPVVPAALSLVVIIMPRRPRDFGYDRSSESTPISFTPLRRLQAAIVLGPVGQLELLGAEVSQRRVGPCPVVEALDVLEDLERRPLSALEGAGVHALRLDEPHERLHRRVVPRAREPVDGLMPASRIVLPIRSETYYVIKKQRKLVNCS